MNHPLSNLSKEQILALKKWLKEFPAHESWYHKFGSNEGSWKELDYEATIDDMLEELDDLLK